MSFLSYANMSFLLYTRMSFLLYAHVSFLFYPRVEDFRTGGFSASHGKISAVGETIRAKATRIRTRSRP